MRDVAPILDSSVSLTQDYKLVPMDQLEEPVRILHLLSSPWRIRILDFLDTTGKPERVTDIVAACEDLPQVMVSQQLRILREGGLVESDRRGNRVFYRIAHPRVGHYLKSVRACKILA